MRYIVSVISCFLISVFAADAQTSQSVADFIIQCEQTAREKVASSQASYGKELDTLKSTYQSKGELENLLAVKNEQDRYKKDGLVLAAHVVQSPDGLRSLQTKYNTNGRQAAQLYLTALETKKKSLTVEGKMDLAMGVKDAIEKIKQAYGVVGESPNADIVKVLVGKWRCKANNWKGIIEFFPDGKYQQYYADGRPDGHPRKWVVQKDRILCDEGSYWNSFLLPLDPDAISGPTWNGKMSAIKIK